MVLYPKGTRQAQPRLCSTEGGDVPNLVRTPIAKETRIAVDDRFPAASLSELSIDASLALTIMGKLSDILEALVLSRHEVCYRDSLSGELNVSTDCKKFSYHVLATNDEKDMIREEIQVKCEGDTLTEDNDSERQ